MINSIVKFAFFNLLIFNVQLARTMTKLITHNEDINGIEITLIGEHELYPFEEFFSEDVYDGDDNSILSIELSLLEFEPNQLVIFLERFKNLEVLTLSGVVWSGSFPNFINLQHLTDVFINRREWSYSDEDSFKTDVLPLFSETFNRIHGRILVEDAYDARIISDVKDFKLKIDKIQFDVQHHFCFTELSVSSTIVDATQLKCSHTEILEIKNSKIVGESIQSFLSKLQNLKNLTICDEESSEYLDFDVSILPVSSIKKLGICGTGLAYTSVPVNFENLEELILQIPFNFTGMFFHRIANIRNPNGSISTKKISIPLKQFIIENKDRNSILDHPFDISFLSIFSETLYLIKILGFYIYKSKNISLGTLERAYFSYSKLDINLRQEFHNSFPNLTYSRLTDANDILLESLMKIPTLYRIYLHDIGSVEDIIERSPVLYDLLVRANVTFRENLIRLYNVNGTWKYKPSPFEDYELTANIAFYSYVFILFSVCIFGIFGNILSIIVLRQKPFRKNSNSSLIIGLAIFDTVVLCTCALCMPLYGFNLVTLFTKIYQPRHPTLVHSGTYIWFLSLFSIPQLERFHANSIYHIQRTAYTGSVGMVLLLTIERFLAVASPLKLRSLTSSKKAKIGFLIILIFSIVFNIPVWWEGKGGITSLKYEFDDQYDWYEIYVERKYTMPNLLENRYYREYYHGYTWIILMYFFPIPTVIILNIKIWIHVRQFNKKRRQMMTSRGGKSGNTGLFPSSSTNSTITQNTNFQTSNSDSSSDTASITRMLLCVSTVFAIFNTVNGAIVWTMVSFDSFDPRDVGTFSSIPVILNCGSNFLIYCLYGTKFQQELFKLLEKLKISCKTN